MGNETGNSDENCAAKYVGFTGCIPFYHHYPLVMTNIAMENGPFIDDFPIKTSIYKGFSMAMLNNQMVIFKSLSRYHPQIFKVYGRLFFPHEQLARQAIRVVDHGEQQKEAFKMGLQEIMRGKSADFYHSPRGLPGMEDTGFSHIFSSF